MTETANDLLSDETFRLRLMIMRERSMGVTADDMLAERAARIANEERARRLYLLLIDVGRAMGAGLMDGVSDEFLAGLVEEATLVRAARIAEAARADKAEALFNACAEARDGAGYIGTVPDCIDDLTVRAEAAEAKLAAVEVERDKAREDALREAAGAADAEKRIYHSGESDFDHGAYMASDNIKARILALTAPAGGEGNEGDTDVEEWIDRISTDLAKFRD